MTASVISIRKNLLRLLSRTEIKQFAREPITSPMNRWELEQKCLANWSDDLMAVIRKRVDLATPTPEETPVGRWNAMVKPPQ